MKQEHRVSQGNCIHTQRDKYYHSCCIHIMNTLSLLRWTIEVKALTLLFSLPSRLPLGSRPTTPLLLLHHLLFPLIFPLTQWWGEQGCPHQLSSHLITHPHHQIQSRDPCDVVNNGPPFCCSPLYSRESSRGQDRQCWICVFWPAFLLCCGSQHNPVYLLPLEAPKKYLIHI